LGVELENTPENTFLVRRFLKALKQRFDGNDGSAHIDEGMFNAGRITKAAEVWPDDRSHIMAAYMDRGGGISRQRAYRQR
jgi:hypothetical protein